MILNLSGFFFFNNFCRQDILGQFSMVNLELFNIVEEIKKVSKAFVVHPKNVTAENATSIFHHHSLIYILINKLIN